MTKFWRFSAKFGSVSAIEDKVLKPKRSKIPSLKYPKFTENIGVEVLSRIKKTLDKHGDYDWLINGHFKVTGETSGCGKKTKSLKDFVRDSKLYGASFWRSGLRKGQKKGLIFVQKLS